MDKQFAIRLPGHVVAVLQTRAEALATNPTTLLRQIVIDGLNSDATEQRMRAAVLESLDQKLTEYTKKVIEAAKKARGT